MVVNSLVQSPHIEPRILAATESNWIMSATCAASNPITFCGREYEARK